MSFGKHLKSILVEKNITQAELANRTGLSPMTISSYVREERSPNYYSIRDICIALDISADYLLELKEN